MTFKTAFLAGLLLMLGALCHPARTRARPQRAERARCPALLSELARVASLSAEQRRRELAGLEASDASTMDGVSAGRPAGAR